MSQRILRWPELREKKINIARSTAWRWGKLGLFPAPVKLGSLAVGWVEAEIDEWIASRLKKGEQRA